MQLIPLVAGAAVELRRGVLLLTRSATAEEARGNLPRSCACTGRGFTAVERKREAADLEASLDRLGGDACS